MPQSDDITAGTFIAIAIAFYIYKGMFCRHKLELCSLAVFSSEDKQYLSPVHWTIEVYVTLLLKVSFIMLKKEELSSVITPLAREFKFGENFSPS